MTFLHSTLAAAGIASVAIPIIIHLLFRQRRKPIPWAAMRFLLEALRKQRKRLRLETLLLLATRCLLLLCIGLAIARPLLEKAGVLGGGPSGRDVYLLIDNGLASSQRPMTAPGAASASSALDRHKAAAKSMIETLGVNDRVGLVTLAAPAESVVVPAASDARAVLSVIDELRSTDSVTDIAGAMERLGARLRASVATADAVARQTLVVVLSEFTQGSADVSRPLPGAGALAGLKNVSLIASPPIDSSELAGNVQVTAVEPLRAVVLTGGSGPGKKSGGEAQQVRVSLRRTGSAVGQEGVTAVRVRVADASTAADAASTQSPAAQASARWSPGQTEATVTMQVESGIDAGAGASASRSGERVLIAEIDRDAIAGDNIRRRPVEVRERLQVAVVAQRVFGSAGRVDKLGAADWYRLALRPGEEAPVEVVDLEPSALDTPALALLDAVVLPSPDQIPGEAWTKLRKFADGGGLIIVSPPEGATVHLWADSFVKAFGLPWRIAREATEAKDGPMTLAAPDEAAYGPGGSVAEDGASIFALIAPELKQLIKPVGVMKWLGVEDTRSVAGAASSSAGQTRALLRLRNGAAWMLASRVGASGVTPTSAATSSTQATTPAEGAASRGLVVFLGSAPVLSWTDLPARPLMVPLIQEIVRQGLGEAGGSMSSIAGQPLNAPSGAAELRPIGAQASPSAAATALVVGATGGSATAVRSAGLWRAVDGAGRSRGMIAVNADTDGGKLGTQSPDVVRAWLVGAIGTTDSAGSENSGPAPAGDAVAWLDLKKPSLAIDGAGPKGSPFTLPLLWAALGLALLEVFLARWFSHAHVGAAADISPSSNSMDSSAAVSTESGAASGAVAA